MYNLIEAMKIHGSINSEGNIERLCEAQEKLDAWLLEHTFIAKYLDPFYVIVEPSTGGVALPVTLDGTVGLLPEVIGRTPIKDIGRTRFRGIFRCLTRHDSYAVASIIRGAHGNGHGGGGPGVYLKIVIIQSSNAFVNI
jgi:hypothetical protein